MLQDRSNGAAVRHHRHDMRGHARLLACVRLKRSPLHDVRQHARLVDRRSVRNLFSRTNRNPASSLPRNGGARRDRTDDLLLAKQALSQLSYGPGPSRYNAHRFRNSMVVVGLGRLELPTSRLSSARSNQLSYKPKPLRSGTWRSRPWWSSQQTATVIG